MNNNQEQEYGLFTAITMIVGIVIGSGIFFKSDNILVFTNGSIIRGVMLFCLAAVGIIFGALTIAILAARTDRPGGIITYIEEYVGPKSAGAFGWFQIFVYYPALGAVITWIIGVYMCMLFGWKATPENYLIIGVASYMICFGVNYFSAEMGGYIQNFSTVVKLLVLFGLAAAGFIYGDPKSILEVKQSMGPVGGSLAGIGALAPIAFSYDGWIVSTSISHEIKDSKRNLPLALIIGPILVLFTYVFYFVGISILVGPQKIIELGDSHVNIAVEMLLGEVGAKVFLVLILISVVGGLNGFILGFIRMPYSLAIREMFPMSEKVSYIAPHHHIPKFSAKIVLGINMIWIFINYVTQKYNMVPNSDVSEIPIVASYLLFTILYMCVILMYFKGEIRGVIKGLIVPVIATIGSLFIVLGGLQNPMTVIYLLICFAVMGISLIYLTRLERKSKLQKA